MNFYVGLAIGMTIGWVLGVLLVRAIIKMRAQ